ncbi:F-box protein MAX2 homolog A [Physcomitrium patens]|uniref:COI1 F-box domain-containing protein n=1 Tax=Physcomitrium patens TaxID=3218 RepID=A0A2K1J2C3_PHYPA|nr:F-box/LRR-repeat MAX2 homolog A-like [Physcomitrium patens]PNR35678.1 hypothetical protein PHYPA_021528 [Physcomitrium patens]|eukprot:XP_024400746.1 F-box/LRR-repeat MAX2 homolog A-like [Physcomitrella patens]
MEAVQWPSLFVHSESDRQSMQSSPEAAPAGTHISDLPSVILTNIIAYVSNPRVRNCISLACRDWYFIERQTRTELSLRGNICVMHELPTCFQQICTLDLSQCSPWGSSLFQSTQNGEEIGNCLRIGFPNVVNLTVYVRDALDIQMVAWIWPDLEIVKLVRWHPRAMESSEADDLGNEIEGLLSACKRLKSLDLSKFYCWTEDIPPALRAGASTAANLRVLNLLKLSPNGFKAQEVGAITSSCFNLEEFYILCDFDHRLLDSVGDEALLSIATNCPLLKVLHLVDYNEWSAVSDDPNQDAFAAEDSSLSRQGLEAMFKALPHLEDLVFYLSQNLRDSGAPFEILASSCKKLRSLKLSNFLGVCGGPHPDGIALCHALQELRLKNCGDLTDDALKAISVGCPKLSKLGLRQCKSITKEGLHACVKNLSHTLKDVEIAGCKLLPTAMTLKALEPIQVTVKNLHLDCVWDEGILAQEASAARTQSTVDSLNHEQSGFGLPIDIGCMGGMSAWSQRFSSTLEAYAMNEMIGAKTDSFLTPHRLVTKRRKLNKAENGGDSGMDIRRATAYSSMSLQIFGGEASSSASFLLKERPGTGLGSGNLNSAQGFPARSMGPGGTQQLSVPGAKKIQTSSGKVWKSLESLSLWIPVGEVISPLAAMGLEECPALHELKLKVEGDGRLLRKPSTQGWGINSFGRYPKLEKVELDLSEVTGFSLSAPKGFTDLSSWERHYLVGINELLLTELDYWPPSDKEVNRRAISLPGAGLLSLCSKLRKLFVHGTAHEHFLNMITGCRCLRDVQLRGDYYPAPEQETTTELRSVSCQRFEALVAKRGFPD